MNYVPELIIIIMVGGGRGLANGGLRDRKMETERERETEVDAGWSSGSSVN